MKNHVELYEGADKVEEISIKFTIDEILESRKSIGIGTDTIMCDLCDVTNGDFYFCPELGSKLICENCMKEHKKRVKWYDEDLHFTYNTLITFLYNYKFVSMLSERDVSRINEYLSNHSKSKLEDFKKYFE